MKLTHNELIKNGYRLVFEDHFDGDRLDDYIWTVMNIKQEGHDGKNAFRLPENVKVEDSCLTITARINQDGDYTSGMVNTGKHLCYRYGYAEIRAKLPIGGDGIWPGFWMKSDFKGSNVLAEIDIFEMFGDDTKISCNLHTWWSDRIYHNHHHINYLDGRGYPKTKVLDNGARFSDDFHTIGYYWTEEFVEFTVDGKPYCHIDITNPVLRSFHTPEYFIISMAFGLPHIKAPDKDRKVPIEYKIDYIRLYQNDRCQLYGMDEERRLTPYKK